MAGPFYVDDGGDGTTESSWATADTSINNLDAEYAFASGEIVYFGHDHVCQATNAASLTITGPTSGAPVRFISATQGSSPPAYQASTTAQIDTTEGAYSITFDGSFALYGLSVKSGANISLNGDFDEHFYAESCRFAPGANGQILQGSPGRLELNNCVIDLTADGTTNRSTSVISGSVSTTQWVIRGLSFVNAAYRTGIVIEPGGAPVMYISGCDFSGFTNATACELIYTSATSTVRMSHCLTASTWTPFTGVETAAFDAMLVNVGPAAAPTYLYHRSMLGSTLSSSAISRSGGATVEGVSTAWLVTSTSSCSEASPYYAPWIYGYVSSTGSKTFTVYITNDTADFTDAEVWLEIEYPGTASEAISTLASDRRADLTTTAAAQTDDVTSTWTGSGPSYTYKQSLAVTVTVNETGTYRARVRVGVASIASSRYFYIDPKITVS